MKQFFLVLSVSVMAGVAVHCQVKPKVGAAKPKTSVSKPVRYALKSSIDSFSYALGLNIAKNLQQQGIDNISNVAMQFALDDVFKKKPVLLNDQEANACIQQKIQTNMTKKNEVVRSKGLAFLAANKKREGVIALPNGLQYEVIKKGDGGSATPKLQDTVVAHYAGTLIDGKKFDNSYDRGEPLTIAVGGVIRGWTEILQLMHIGDKWKVYIPSELAYGDRGAGNDIPGGSALIFELELLGIKSADAKEEPKKN